MRQQRAGLEIDCAVRVLCGALLKPCDFLRPAGEPSTPSAAYGGIVAVAFCRPLAATTSSSRYNPRRRNLWLRSIRGTARRKATMLTRFARIRVPRRKGMTSYREFIVALKRTLVAFNELGALAEQIDVVIDVLHIVAFVQQS